MAGATHAPKSPAPKAEPQERLCPSGAQAGPQPSRIQGAPAPLGHQETLPGSGYSADPLLGRVAGGSARSGPANREGPGRGSPETGVQVQRQIVSPATRFIKTEPGAGGPRRQVSAMTAAPLKRTPGHSPPTREAAA
jgi:hypothetical protein